MNIQVDPTSSNLASAMFNKKIRPREVVGYGVEIFHPSPPNYVTGSPGRPGMLPYTTMCQNDNFTDSCVAHSSQNKSQGKMGETCLLKVERLNWVMKNIY